MSVHRTPKSGLFLLELVIIILFFSVTSAVCVSLFAGAHVTSGKSTGLSRAMLEVQTAAESVKASEGDARALAGLLGAEPGEGGYRLYYGRGWERVSAPEDAAYTLAVVPALGADGMLTARVEMAEDGRTIFGLEVKRYVG